jgi:hypothetical protein
MFYYYYYNYYYYFNYSNNIGLQVSHTFKSQRRQYSLINRHIPWNSMILMNFFFQFCTKCGKLPNVENTYIRSFAIPLWTSFIVFNKWFVYPGLLSLAVQTSIYHRFIWTFVYCACGSVVVEALCYKPKGRGFETRWRELILSFHLIVPAALDPGVCWASDRNEYQKQKQKNNVSAE